MFLLHEMRDPQTVLWMEEFTQPNIDPRLFANEDIEQWQTGEYVGAEEVEKAKPMATLLNYHGLGAINTTLFPTWEDYFRQLLDEPTVVYNVTSSYKHIPDYELEIDPSSLSRRLLSVRSQIANEFVHDLGIIAKMGEETLESYWENLKQQAEVDRENSNSTTVKVTRQNLMFLGWSPSENGLSPSPLRKGNFDLLTLFCTQEAIHQVLNDESLKEGPESTTKQFLEKFYEERIISHFTGVQPYGRADDFLEELLLLAPRMIQEGGVASLVDPMGIVKSIMKVRKQVALDWKEIVEDSSREHSGIQRLQLNRLMGINNNAAWQ